MTHPLSLGLYLNFVLYPDLCFYMALLLVYEKGPLHTRVTFCQVISVTTSYRQKRTRRTI